MVVFPNMMTPAPLSRSTRGASSLGTLFSKILDPRVVCTSLVIIETLKDTGTPCSAPNGSPLATTCSARLASSMAVSLVIV